MCTKYPPKKRIKKIVNVNKKNKTKSQSQSQFTWNIDRSGHRPAVPGREACVMGERMTSSRLGEAASVIKSRERDSNGSGQMDRSDWMAYECFINYGRSDSDW